MTRSALFPTPRHPRRATSFITCNVPPGRLGSACYLRVTVALYMEDPMGEPCILAELVGGLTVQISLVPAKPL